MEGRRVPLAGFWRCPRRVERHLCGHLVERHDRLHNFAQRLRIVVRNWPFVGHAAYRAEFDVGRVRAIGREALNAHFLPERDDAILSGARPLPADLQRRAVIEIVVLDAPAHAAAGLQHDDRLARLHELARGGQAGESSSDDRDINGFLRHGNFPPGNRDDSTRLLARPPSLSGGRSAPGTRRPSLRTPVSRCVRRWRDRARRRESCRRTSPTPRAACGASSGRGGSSARPE